MLRAQTLACCAHSAKLKNECLSGCPPATSVLPLLTTRNRHVLILWAGVGHAERLALCATIQGLRTMRQTLDIIIPHHPIWVSLDVGYLRRFTGLAPSLRLRTSRSWPISQSRRRSAFQSRWASPEA